MAVKKVVGKKKPPMPSKTAMNKMPGMNMPKGMPPKTMPGKKMGC